MAETGEGWRKCSKGWGLESQKLHRRYDHPTTQNCAALSAVTTLCMSARLKSVAAGSGGAGLAMERSRQANGILAAPGVHSPALPMACSCTVHAVRHLKFATESAQHIIGLNTSYEMRTTARDAFGLWSSFIPCRGTGDLSSSRELNCDFLCRKYKAPTPDAGANFVEGLR